MDTLQVESEKALYIFIDINIMKNIYLLKDLSKISGLSTHTLKFYLKLGLLKEIGRSPETKFRYFDDSSCERLHKIRELQNQSLSLKEILSFLEGLEEDNILCPRE